MQLYQFVCRMNGPRLLSLTESEPPMRPREFHFKYRFTPEWKKEVIRFDIIPHGDKVIVLIALKEEI